MTTWKPILEEKEDVAFVFDILHQTANDLYLENEGAVKNSLFYGNLGKVVFLANYLNLVSIENDGIDEKMSDMIDDIYQSTGETVYADIAKSTSYQRLNYSFDKGISGFGWGLNYLIKSRFLEGDINDIMSLADAGIYRQMIEKMHKSDLGSFNTTVLNGKYAVCRNGRFVKEYLQRFISEFYELKYVYYKKYESEDNRIDDLVRLIDLLRRINMKYKFEETNELLRLYYPLLYAKTLHLEDINIQYLYAWFILCHADEYNRQIAGLIKKRYDLLEDQAGRLLLDVGLQKGLVFTGHLSNRFYQTFDILECKHLSLKCFNSLLNMYKTTNDRSLLECQSTASQMLWGVHQNLYNGISGIGLALIAAISDKIPNWDECII